MGVQPILNVSSFDEDVCPQCAAGEVAKLPQPQPSVRTRPKNGNVTNLTLLRTTIKNMRKTANMTTTLNMRTTARSIDAVLSCSTHQLCTIYNVVKSVYATKRLV
jgi:hypothetical protein